MELLFFNSSLISHSNSKKKSSLLTSLKESEKLKLIDSKLFLFILKIKWSSLDKILMKWYFLLIEEKQAIYYNNKFFNWQKKEKKKLELLS